MIWVCVVIQLKVLMGWPVGCVVYTVQAASRLILFDLVPQNVHVKKQWNK